MAFTDAIFDRFAALEGLSAQRADTLPELTQMLTSRRLIPVTTLPLPLILDALSPTVLVDARMNKHHRPESQINLAALTVGLGPNFIAGETTRLAVETAWGESLGRIISKGATNPLQGEPKPIVGHARDRYLYSPAEGPFHTPHQIGDHVQRGQEIARVNDLPLYAPISGVLRGLTHDGVPVGLRTKVIEVDPRTHNAQISGIAERPARIARGVLQAIQNWEGANAH